MVKIPRVNHSWELWPGLILAYDSCMRKNKNSRLLPALCSLLLIAAASQSALASAELELSESSRTLKIAAKLHFYGGQATPEIAAAAAEEINVMWNAANAQAYTFSRGYGDYYVRMEVDWEIISEAEAHARIPFEKSCRNNYIRVEHTEGIVTFQNRSSWMTTNPFVPWGFNNTGYFNVRDELGSSTTVAHEFGHALGLMHSRPVVKGQPGIMAARGTLVDPEFQNNPQALQGEPGSTINVRLRKVLRSDVEEVLSKIADLKMIGNKIEEEGPPLPGVAVNPNCLGMPTHMAFDPEGKPFPVPKKN